MLKFDDYCLRALEPYDLDALYFWENDLNSYTNHEQFYSRFTLEKYIEQAHLSLNEAKQYRFVISKPNEPDLCLGFLDLVDFDFMHKRLEVGILISPKYRQKQLAKKALLRVEKYLKNNFDLEQVYCYIETDNLISINLFESLDYEKSGTLKRWRRFNQVWKDVDIYQKILSSKV